MTSKDPIKLRRRKGSNDVVSLYLETYLNGQREYEYLKLYLYPENTREDKIKNRQTLQLAEAIRAQRLVDYQNGRFGFDAPSRGQTSLIEYLTKIRDKKKAAGKSSWANCNRVLTYLKRYDTKEVSCKDITSSWVEGFRNFLVGSELSQSTQHEYFSIFRSALRKARNEGLTRSDPTSNVDAIKPRAAKRVYLTPDELKKLAKTCAPSEIVKRAFLFSCLTGLRYSDIYKLTWDEVQEEGEFTRLVFRQKKTGEQEYLDISQNASDLLECRGTGKVFEGMPCDTTVNSVISVWCQRAGIKKHVTFHSGRHTFAVMMLDLGADIYTVSKLLGHTNIATTQIYAKVLDKNKQKAVEKIPKLW